MNDPQRYMVLGANQLGWSFLPHLICAPVCGRCPQDIGQKFSIFLNLRDGGEMRGTSAIVPLDYSQWIVRFRVKLGPTFGALSKAEWFLG
jgi:hypothetical protein